MDIEIGQTYTFRDGAGQNAILVRGILNGFAYGLCAVDTDGEDITTYEEGSVQLSNLIEKIGGINWDNAKNLSEV